MSSNRIAIMSEHERSNPHTPEQFDVLGIPISIVDMASATSAIFARVATGQFGMVFVRDVPSLMLATEDDELRELHKEAFLVVPDGMPLVWLGRIRGFGGRIGRVAGADLVDAVCAASIGTGYSHYFFGGKPGVAETMAARLSERHPGLHVAGTFSPPIRDIGAGFRPDSEALAEVSRIAATKGSFIWVGISSPKQEYWMKKAAPLVGKGVFLGVGAAFDFHAGVVKRAPRWMQRSGLEWLHRLMSEPRRLWRRYLILAPQFAFRTFFKELNR